MARRLRVQFPGAIYHVMNRGDRRETIFHDDTDREQFTNTLADACGKTAWKIQVFCLMPNHFHIVVETPLPNLVDGMKWFLGTYSARFNRRRKLAGHVFSGRYKSLLVGGEGGYLRTVCDYVHLNPARGNLLAQDQPLRSYRWSSFPLYLLPTAQRPDWLSVGRLLGEWGIPRDNPSGRQLFEQALEARRMQEQEDEFGHIRHDWCLGSPEFRQRILEEMGNGFGAHHYGQEVQESAEAKANRIVNAELLNVGWTERDLAERRKGDVHKVRIARRLRAETTMTLKWIADRLHMGTSTHLGHLLYWQRRRDLEKINSQHGRDDGANLSILGTDPKLDKSTILGTDPYLFDPTFN